MRDSSYHRNDLMAITQDYHKCYDPLAYPIFFPFGADGWNLNTKSSTMEKKVTHFEFMRYHIMKRNNYAFLLSGQQLFQQIITDQYTRVESARLRWAMKNQATLSADL